MNAHTSFRRNLERELSRFLERQAARFPKDETLRIDPHCHDWRSGPRKDAVARTLRLPETWTSTDEVLAALGRSGVDAVTITNHDDVKSCYELQDKGIDVLVGAEFSCVEPEYGASLHVLVYGFTPEEEARLMALRRDLFAFLDYTLEHDLVTVLAHPLFYHLERTPPVRMIEKLTLLFDNFEVLNGQREIWQNVLMATWLEQLTPERVEEMCRNTGIEADRFARRPFNKGMIGGSDCHMACFVGATGTLIHVPNLRRRQRMATNSELVLEGLKAGRFAPYGTPGSAGQLTASALDYFGQVVDHSEDPGLLNLLLQPRSLKERALSVVAANAVLELKRHPYASKFLRAFQQALAGRRPGLRMRYSVSKPYRGALQEVDRIAQARGEDDETFEATLESALPKIFREMMSLFLDRLSTKLETSPLKTDGANLALDDVLGMLELPAHWRSTFGRDKDGNEAESVNIAEKLTGLPFPLAAASAVAGAHLGSCWAMSVSRSLLNDVAEGFPHLRHPERALWLTDTWGDRNGVSNSLRLIHGEVKRRDLPVDFLVCNSETEADEHLRVVEPLAEFVPPVYPDQLFRVPDLMEIAELFLEGGYDRVVSSTEAPMGLVALYLKRAFSVPAYFYLHTDWISFARRTIHLNHAGVDRVKKLLRTFYTEFDGIIVLNTDQKEWLAGDEIGFPREKIFLTNHWAGESFAPRGVTKEDVFPGVTNDEPVVLYAGRISAEKGVLELSRALQKIRRKVPNARLVLAGTGHDEGRVRERVPDAVFLGWVDREKLARSFSAADVMLFPSRFDTFGRVILEANSCGLPVISYPVMGPKDIIVHGRTGYLAKDTEEMAEYASALMNDPELLRRTRQRAIERAATYTPERTVTRLMDDLGLPWETAEELPSRYQALVG